MKEISDSAARLVYAAYDFQLRPKEEQDEIAIRMFYELKGLMHSKGVRDLHQYFAENGIVYSTSSYTFRGKTIISHSAMEEKTGRSVILSFQQYVESRDKE